MDFCTYLAEFDCKTRVYVGQRNYGDQNIVTVDVGVEFFNPKKLDRRPLPHPCNPSLPKLVGSVNKIRLIWATNLHQAGDWIFTTRDKTDEDAQYLGYLQGQNSRTDYWRFTFRLPPWGIWKSVHADYTLFPPYKQRIAKDNCAFYNDDSDDAENHGHVFGGEGLTTLDKWEPTETDLPYQDYECNFLNLGDVLAFTTPTKVQQVLVAPPDGLGYRINYDYLGGYRNNLVEVGFREPGIYAVKVIYQSGESVRFAAVNTLGQNTVTGTKQTLKLGLMKKADIPASHCALFVSNDVTLAEYSKLVLTNFKMANDVGVISQKIDECFREAGKPVSVLLASHGQPGQFELAGTNVNSFPAGYGYGGQCAATWELDRIIDGCECEGQSYKGLKGCADSLHLWAGLTGALLEENTCHVLRYVAERMVEQGGVQVATASAWDCPFFIVAPGTTRPGYYTYPTGGNYVTYTSHSTYLPMGSPNRESTESQPNFYA